VKLHVDLADPERELARFGSLQEGVVQPLELGLACVVDHLLVEERAHLASFEEYLHVFECVAIDEHVAGCAVLLQPRGEVHDVPDRGIRLAPRADEARDRRA
jgi:hypothetical protein